MKTPEIINESSPGSLPVIYIQLDGGHVGFCQNGGTIGLTLPCIIKTTSGLASPTQYTPNIDVSFMILALLVFKLQLTSQPHDGFRFCQYGVPVRRPSKFQTV